MFIIVGTFNFRAPLEIVSLSAIGEMTSFPLGLLSDPKTASRSNEASPEMGAKAQNLCSFDFLLRIQSKF